MFILKWSVCSMRCYPFILQRKLQNAQYHTIGYSELIINLLPILLPKNKTNPGTTDSL